MTIKEGQLVKVFDSFKISPVNGKNWQETGDYQGKEGNDIYRFEAVVEKIYPDLGPYGLNSDDTRRLLMDVRYLDTQTISKGFIVSSWHRPLCWHCRREIRPRDLDDQSQMTRYYNDPSHIFHRRRGCYEKFIEDVMEQKYQLYLMGEYVD